MDIIERVIRERVIRDKEDREYESSLENWNKLI